jgi:calcium/calmodulin-dependent protein kinase I
LLLISEQLAKLDWFLLEMLSFDCKYAFDDYYTDIVGEGLTCTVKLAKRVDDDNDTSTYAVKILNRSTLADLGITVGNVMNEYKILKSLNHINIMKCYDFFQEIDDLKLICEYLSGGELFQQIIDKKSYTEKEVRDICHTVLEGIAYFHEKNIVHRDLKPQNLLLSDKSDYPIIKIVDFGFATYLGSEFEDNELLKEQIGTPGFIPPEILRNDFYGKEVDLWSFGVIVYLLLSGEMPFDGTTDQIIDRKILEGSFTFPNLVWYNISEEAKDFICCLLVIDQQKRYTAEQALSHPWITASSDETLQSKAIESSERLDATLKKLKNRRRWKAAIKAVRATHIFRRLSLQRRASASQDSTAVSTVVSDLKVENTASTSISSVPAAVTKKPCFSDFFHFSVNDKIGNDLYGNNRYKGIYKETGEEVCITKYENSFLLKNDKFLKTLQNEIMILKSLPSPTPLHIIKFYDFINDSEDSSSSSSSASGCCYLITELLTGKNLLETMLHKSSSYTEEEVKKWIYKVLEGIKILSDSHIVHRNLSPEQLVFSNESYNATIKITGFEYAKKLEMIESDLLPSRNQSTHRKKSIALQYNTTAIGLIGKYGSFGFIAPEILMGKPYSKSVDIWSLGIIIYLLLVGYHPFYDEDFSIMEKNICDERLYDHLFSQVQYWDYISEEAKYFLRECLHYQSEYRLTIDQALDHDWFRSSSTSSSSSSSPSSQVLKHTVNLLKKRRAKQRFRAAVKVIIFRNRLAKLFVKQNKV